VKNVNKSPLLTFSSTFPLRFDFSGLLLALLLVVRPPRDGLRVLEGAALRGWLVAFNNGSRFAADGPEDFTDVVVLSSFGADGDEDIR
jgi:hypothetical protein